jgi:hypothetical protein
VVGDRAHDRRAGLVVRRDEVEGEALLEDADAGDGADLLQEHALELFAGGVAVGVDDAAVAVATLAAQSGAVRGVAVDVHAPADELVDEAGATLGDELHDGGVAHTGARGEGVVDVGLDAVVLSHDAGDAALGPGGVGGLEVALGEDDDLAVG